MKQNFTRILNSSLISACLKSVPSLARTVSMNFCSQYLLGFGYRSPSRKETENEAKITDEKLVDDKLITNSNDFQILNSFGESVH